MSSAIHIQEPVEAPVEEASLEPAPMVEPELEAVDLGRALDLASTPEPVVEEAPPEPEVEEVPVAFEEPVETPVEEAPAPSSAAQSRDDLDRRRPGKRSETQLIGFLVAAAVVLILVLVGVSRMLGDAPAAAEPTSDELKVAMPIPDSYVDG